MGDQYNVGQAGAIGPNASASNFSMHQTTYSLPPDTNYEELVKELADLKALLLSKAKDPEHYISIAEVSKAETAAKAKDGSKVLTFLKDAGSWVWGQFKDLAPGIISSVIKVHLGV